MYVGCIPCQKQLKLSWKGDECKPLVEGELCLVAPGRDADLVHDAVDVALCRLAEHHLPGRGLPSRLLTST